MNREEIKLTPEELKSIKDSESFRATLLIEMKYFRRDIDFLLSVKDGQFKKCEEQTKCCKNSWRSDMLWFCGVPAGTLSFILIIIGLVNHFKG